MSTDWYENTCRPNIYLIRRTLILILALQWRITTNEENIDLTLTRLRSNVRNFICLWGMTLLVTMWQRTCIRLWDIDLGWSNRNTITSNVHRNIRIYMWHYFWNIEDRNMNKMFSQFHHGNKWLCTSCGRSFIDVPFPNSVLWEQSSHGMLWARDLIQEYYWLKID